MSSGAATPPAPGEQDAERTRGRSALGRGLPSMSLTLRNVKRTAATLKLAAGAMSLLGTGSPGSRRRRPDPAPALLQAPVGAEALFPASPHPRCAS